MTRSLIKICGTTTILDAQMSARAGADYLGVIVDHAPSPRSVNLSSAQDIFLATKKPTVAVTVNRSLDDLLFIADLLQPAALQLHGDETPELVRDLKGRKHKVWAVCSGSGHAVKERARRMSEAGADAVLIDARAQSSDGIVYGGTGHLSDWELARELVDEGLCVILAGGLAPENVARAIEEVKPWMVDVVSGIEARKGVKDDEKVRQFVAAAKH